jgi:hypothetical protein
LSLHSHLLSEGELPDHSAQVEPTILANHRLNDYAAEDWQGLVPLHLDDLAEDGPLHPVMVLRVGKTTGLKQGVGILPAGGAGAIVGYKASKTGHWKSAPDLLHLHLLGIILATKPRLTSVLPIITCWRNWNCWLPAG